VKIPRAPRSKKRIACELSIDGDRYKGIVLDIAVFGMFVQTNARPMPGSYVEVSMSIPGESVPVVLGAVVARRNVVPPQLLTVARGGVGLAIEEPPKAYVDFLCDVSPEQSEFVTAERRKGAVKAGRGGPGSAKGGAGSGSVGSKGGPPPAKRFRIHAVDTKNGAKNTFLTISASEAEARAKVVDELGEDWQVLFIEHA
jgi:hypothetical protein